MKINVIIEFIISKSLLLFFSDDLEIKAVQDCIEMGYTEEQIGDALSKLKQRRPGLFL